MIIDGKEYVDCFTLVNGEPMYAQCLQCDYQTHICGGCGTEVTHSHHESRTKLHNSERPYCYE